MALDIGVATLNIHNGSEASGGPGRTIINKRGLGLGYYEYKDRTPGGHQRANSQSVSIPAGV